MEGPQESNYPINILSAKSIKLLSDMLNPIKVLRTEEGLPRYWKGLAELCAIETYVISSLESKNNPTEEILKILKKREKITTIKELLKCLEKLDRFDVIEETHQLIEDDIEYHKQHPSDYKNEICLYNDQEKCVLIADDESIKYDAFVLFADDDSDFATEMIETMEKQYNLKFCVKDRDLIVGTFEHRAMVKLISEKCEKLIVILSPSFFNSAMNKFFLIFTQAISLEERKIIPCLYKQCPDMPAEIRCYFMLDHTKPRVLWNFWDKLYEAIKTQKVPTNICNRINLSSAGNDQKSHSVVNLRNTNMQKKTHEINLTPCSNTNSLKSHQERENKIEQISKWFPKFLQKHEKNDKCNQLIDTKTDVENNKEKKRFWNRDRKTKEEIAF